MKKRSNNSAVTENDARLFRESLTDVVPLRRSHHAVDSTARPRPVPLQHLRDEQAALTDSLSDPISWDDDRQTGEELLFLRNGISRHTLRKLRHGQWVIQDELDLHGSTSAEARMRLASFLNSCVKDSMRCVRIIHGKGLRSKNREPVLKSKVAHWLAQRDEVLAFCQARAADGGGGAALVLLKSNSKKP